MSSTVPAKRTADGEEIPAAAQSIERVVAEGAKYALVVKAGGLVSTAGLVADDLSADAKGQAEQILAKADKIIEEHQLRKDQLVSANVWVANISEDFAKVNEVWDAWVDTDNVPVRAAVEGGLVTPDYLVEIQFYFDTAAETIERFDKTPRYCLVTKAGDTTYFAGLIADDTAADTKGQTEQILAKAEGLMAQHGLEKRHLVASTVWLKDLAADFAALNEVWEGWHDPACLPVRATVQANLATPAHAVEVQFTFYTGAAEVGRHAPNGRYCPAVRAGPKVYFAGLIADDRGQDAAGQTAQVLAKADALMAAHGLAKADLLSGGVWLADVGRDFAAMNEGWWGWVDRAAPPTRATVQAALMAPEVLVEIQFAFYRP